MGGTFLEHVDAALDRIGTFWADTGKTIACPVCEKSLRWYASYRILHLDCQDKNCMHARVHGTYKKAPPRTPSYTQGGLF